MSQQQIDNAAAIIIIIDDTVARLTAIKARDLENMRLDKQEALKAELVDAQDLVIGAEAIAT
jgi:hypothetical protein